MSADNLTLYDYVTYALDAYDNGGLDLEALAVLGINANGCDDYLEAEHQRLAQWEDAFAMVGVEEREVMLQELEAEINDA